MNSDKNLVLDFNEICRLCLSKEGVMLPIFDDGSKEDDLPISSRIVMCASIEVSQGDGLPSLVCDRCVNHLDSWYTFKEQCCSSDATLRQYVTSHAKISSVAKISEATVGIFKKDLLSEEYNASDNTSVKDTIGSVRPAECLHATDNSSRNSSEDSYGIEVVQDEVGHSDRVRKAFLCTKCSKKFTSRLYFRDHVASHSGEKQFFCDKCQKGFYSRVKLKSHCKTHETSRPYLCSICGKGFRTKGELKKHFHLHSDEFRFLCSVCGKTFKTGPYLRSHMAAHSGEKRHVCPTCGKAFVWRETLAAHLKTHTLDRPISCPICDKAFKRKEVMTRHMRVHSGERPFVCTFCGCSFADKWNLTQHARRHTGVKPYVCSVCGQAYAHNITLKNHLKRKHNA